MGKNKDPAFTLYSADFLVGVMELSMEERGQYITLLCLQHQKGHLTKKQINSICTVSDSVLEKFIIDDEGCYYNERLDEEMKKRRAYIDKQRENRLDVIARSGANSKLASSNLQASLETRVEIVNENINKDISNVYGLYRNILLTDEELKALKAEFPNDWQQRIEKLSEYIASSGKVYDSHLATIRIWAKTDEEKQKAAEKDKPRYGNFDPNEALEAALRRSRAEN